MKEGKKMEHVPVMLDRCIALLTPPIEKSPNPIVIDATLGLGGHTNELLERFSNLRVIALDRDPVAISKSAERLKKFSGRLTIIHAIYDQIPSILDNEGIANVDGILFDLGVSSMQLDKEERGFSYSKDAPLDMRMDASTGITAADVVNNYQKEELVRILRVYGEERFANRIADNIIRIRAESPILRTGQLAEIVKASIPAPARRVGGNPAKRTFQALRIEVNQELAILERALPAAINSLKVGGRIVVMSFQSLEDKIVKRAFQLASESKSPVGLPIEIDSLKAKYRLVFSGSESASDLEIERNSRAQSVRLRALERVAS